MIENINCTIRKTQLRQTISIIATELRKKSQRNPGLCFSDEIPWNN